MRLSELLKPLNARLIGGDIGFDNLSTDSRQLNAGDLFLALRGENFDGHDYVVDVVNKGACAVVVEREIAGIATPQLLVPDTTIALGQIAARKRQTFGGKVVAITGSSGKTSVKGFLREAFAVTGSVLATQGNFNNHIGVPLTLMRLHNQRFAVIEVGTNHPGEIAYLISLVQPEIALVNNVMAAHIGGFGSLGAIAKEKGDIYSTLVSPQIAIINLDDTFAEEFLARTENARQFGFSLAAKNTHLPNVYAENITTDSAGCAAFILRFAEQSAQVQLRVPGLHNVRNALAAAACALAADCNLGDVAQGLGNFTGEKGRMQIYAGLSGSCIIDDTYNANSGSVMAAIDYLGSRAGERILVLGDLGEVGALGPDIHRDLGRYASSKKLSAVLTVGSLSQLTSLEFGVNGFHFENKTALVDALIPLLNDKTTVLVKGSRSARMEEIARLLYRAEENTPC